MPQMLPIRGNSWDPLIKLHIQALKITVPDNILIMPGDDSEASCDDPAPTDVGDHTGPGADMACCSAGKISPGNMDQAMLPVRASQSPAHRVVRAISPGSRGRD